MLRAQYGVQNFFIKASIVSKERGSPMGYFLAFGLGRIGP
jgi:hypothetical protein